MRKTRIHGTQRTTSRPVTQKLKLPSGSVSTIEWGTPGTGDVAITYDRKTGSNESIVYDHNKSGQFSPCLHSKQEYRILRSDLLGDYSTSNRQYSGSWQGSTAYNVLQRCHAYHYGQYLTASGTGHGVSLSSVQWEAKAQDALQAMLPTFASGNSLVNFLLELKDFKRIVTLIKGRATKWIDVLKEAIGLSHGRKTGKNLSSAYLSYNFAWKPLYNDLQQLYSKMVSFEARYRELVNRAGKHQQSYYGSWLPGTELSEQTTLNSYLKMGGISTVYGAYDHYSQVRVRRLASNGIRYHATLRYRYPLPPELLTTKGRLKAYLDMLGVQRNPAILWNAIPFSFVVDWFFNVSNWLHSLRTDNIQFQTEILDFCHSAKMQRRVVYEIAPSLWHKSPYPSSNVGSWEYGAFVPCDECSIVEYDRRVGIPDIRFAVASSGLSLREFLLGGALLRVQYK